MTFSFSVMFPLLLALVGLIVWFIFTVKPSKVPLGEMGRICFFCGLLVFTFGMSHETVRMGDGRHAAATSP